MTSQEIVTAVVEDERQRRGLSRARVAKMLGVDPSTVTLKLQGKRAWSLEDLDRLGTALGIPPAWFLMSRGTATGGYLRAVTPLAAAA